MTIAGVIKKSSNVVPIKDFIISNRIKEAVLASKPDFDFSGYFVKDDKTFKLCRMKTMLDDSLYKTDIRPPIYATRLFRGYKIENGRHRVARALILGETTISVNFVN